VASAPGHFFRSYVSYQKNYSVDFRTEGGSIALRSPLALKLQELDLGHHGIADTEDQHSVWPPVRTRNLDTLIPQSLDGARELLP